MKDVDYEETAYERDQRRKDPANRHFVPFVVCGDLDGWSSDVSYNLPEGYVSLKPVQPPTEPAYKEALEMKKEHNAENLSEMMEKGCSMDAMEE